MIISFEEVRKLRLEEALFILFDYTLGDIPLMTEKEAEEPLDAVFNVLEALPDKEMAANLAEKIANEFTTEEKIGPVIQRVVEFLKKQALKLVSTPEKLETATETEEAGQGDTSGH